MAYSGVDRGSSNFGSDMSRKVVGKKGGLIPRDRKDFFQAIEQLSYVSRPFMGREMLKKIRRKLLSFHGVNLAQFVCVEDGKILDVSGPLSQRGKFDLDGTETK